MKKYLLYFVVVSLVVHFALASSLSAQIDWNGSIDFEFSAGGKDSKFISNGINNEFRLPHLAINQLNLFAFAEISDVSFFQARIQSDTWGSGTLNDPRLTLANVNWMSEDSPFSVSVGRFINPFGSYPGKQLAADNLFVNPPLAYSYFINISDRLGFSPQAGNKGIYQVDNSSDVGITTIYFGGYTTGALLNWIVIPDRLDLDIAVTNAAIASPSDYTNLANAGVIVKLGLQPMIFWRQGISASFGSFMQSDPRNTEFEGFEKYRQTVVGTDWMFAYSYFELTGEIVYSMWNVPWWNPNKGVFITRDNGELWEFDITNYSAYTDIKVEPPFLTGSYIAFRYELLTFPDFDDPRGSTPPKKQWDDNIVRYSASFGYKLSRSVLLKVAFSDQQKEDVDPDPEDYTIRSILTVSF